MEGFYTDSFSLPEMAQKASPSLTLFGRRSHMPRPISEATLIFDTDDEDDEESQPASLEFDAVSIASSKELTTPPDTAGLGNFTFHFDADVKGPEGPHLFRASSTGSTRELLDISPIPLPRQTRRIQSLHAAVSQLDESQVRDWSPRQVANWMAEAGFEHSVVEKFLIHDIYGSVLLDLEMDDLKEIDIETFGKRRRVMSSIQHLRNSSMIASDLHLPLSSSPERPIRSLSRAARAHETLIVAPQRSKSRRGRSASHDDIIHPAESVSIVAIEQLLPELHTCSKGENCSKWQRQQRKIQKITANFAEESEVVETKSAVTPSIVGPSVAGSSDVLGPVAMPITAESLSTIEPQDPQDNVRQFLEFQSTQRAKDPSPPPAPSALFAAKTSSLMHGLPRLTIPTTPLNMNSPDRTPISALRHPTREQVETKAALLNDPYHYGGVASPADVYRVASPMSETDIPVTALPTDPCQRNFSQSVPPEMHYGAPTPSAFIDLVEPIQRCASTQPRRRQNSFVPKVAPVVETPPIVTGEADLANHAGWMRKRKTTRMLRHEWQDSYFLLNGSKLDMLRDELDTMPVDSIDVDEYQVHAYTTASGSKLHSAFKKSIGASDKEPSFAFSLIPDDQKDKKIFDKSRSHHFAVNSGRDRVEWMRKLMLAKALKKNINTPI